MKSKKKGKAKEDTEEKINVDAATEETQESVVKEVNVDFKDKYIRLYSEFENYRKRTAKEKIEIITNASENVIKEILPIVDDFERAILNNQDVSDAENIKEGLELIYNKLNKTLANQGLKSMDSIEKEFDSDIHEAITKIPAPKEKLKGKVIDVIEKGYTINEKVIRFAKVVVGE
jgi:molecular chaperone GrpE